MIQLENCQTEEAGDCGSAETNIASQAEIETIRRSLIQQNDTGVCLVCKNIIPSLRLQAIPGCLHCISCQSEIDNGRRIIRREEMQYVVSQEEDETPEETAPQPKVKLEKAKKPLSKDEFSKIFS